MSKENAKVDGVEVTRLDKGVEDFSIEYLDGAAAVLRLGKERRLVRQDDLHRIEKAVSAAIQVTY